MGEFFQAAFAFPTVVLTALMGLVLAYWLVFMMGMADLDILGSGDAIGGAGEEAAEAAVEAVAGDGGGVDGLDGGEGGWLERLRNAGLTQVPITLTLSILIFFSWTLSLLGVRLLQRFGIAAESADGPGPVWASVILVAALFGGALATLASLNPLRPLFVRHDAPSRASFVGTECTIFSQRVDASFGLAEIEDGGAGLRVDVRCLEATLKRGDKARVVRCDEDVEVFFVRALEAASNESPSTPTNK